MKDKKGASMSNLFSKAVDRRRFLQGAAGAGLGFWVAGTQAWGDTEAPAQNVSPSEKLNVAFVAVGGRAAENIKGIKPLPNANIIALCDIDDKRLEIAANEFPKAKTFFDYRKMLDEVKEIDAVVVSTPDHNHAIATVAAMKAGKHVYCEKPLTHSLWECRTVQQVAADTKRVTQMGTQIHAVDNYRRVVEIIKAGTIGAIKDVHVFCGKCWGTDKPISPADPVPSYLHYDQWVGPTPFIDYRKEFIPESWRSYYHFGNGSLGDMGCHYMDLVFWSLDLKYPTRVHADGPKSDQELCPVHLEVHWEFPARGEQPPVNVSWYDGNWRDTPLPQVFHDWKLSPKRWGFSVLFIGEKGAMVADYGGYQLLPEGKWNDFKAPLQTIAPSVGHHKEWVDACLRNDPNGPLCHFPYSGPLSETILLGSLAKRIGKPLEWDAENLKVTNLDAEELIHLPYREGWSL
jgi:predicted dehydrogenase